MNKTTPAIEEFIETLDANCGELTQEQRAIEEYRAYCWWQGWDERQEKFAAVLIAAGTALGDVIPDEVATLSHYIAGALFDTEEGADDANAASGKRK